MNHSVYKISKKLEKVHLFGIYDSWKSIRPWAYRKDIWSQLILWDQGGIFMDAKMYFESPVDWIDWESDELIMCGDHGARFSAYWNGFMASTRYHPFRLVTVMESVMKIKSKYS